MQNALGPRLLRQADWTNVIDDDDPMVCGTIRRSSVLAESTCEHCNDPIFEVPFGWITHWRHANGFLVCISRYPDKCRATPKE